MDIREHTNGDAVDVGSSLARKDSMGYHTHRFSAKNAQMERVAKLLKEKGFIPQDLVDPEVQWFYGNLGIDDVYFQTQSVDTVVEHILALYGAKIFAFVKSEHALDINLERETEDGAVYIHTSRPGVSTLTGPQYEKRMDERYLDRSDTKVAYRMESYRSAGTISSSISSSLRCYFISKCNFVKPDPTPAEATNIELVSDRSFLELATKNTKDIYGHVMQEVLNRTGAVIEMFDLPSSREKRLVIGYRQKTTQGFFSALSDLYHYYELFSSRKYV
ncbi:NAD-dependent glutamate dehydrogenase, partial [Gonapodya sp. JEL0774]